MIKLTDILREVRNNKVDSDLHQIVIDFVDSHDMNLHTPCDTSGYCKDISDELADWLDDHDIAVRVIKLDTYIGDYHKPYKDWANIEPHFWTHYIVWLDDENVGIDLTARQFNGSANMPRYISKSELSSEWENIDWEYEFK